MVGNWTHSCMCYNCVIWTEHIERLWYLAPLSMSFKRKNYQIHIWTVTEKFGKIGLAYFVECTIRVHQVSWCLPIAVCLWYFTKCLSTILSLFGRSCCQNLHDTRISPLKKLSKLEKVPSDVWKATSVKSRQTWEKYWSQQEEHVQVPNGTGPGAGGVHSPLLACNTWILLANTLWKTLTIWWKSSLVIRSWSG